MVSPEVPPVLSTPANYTYEPESNSSSNINHKTLSEAQLYIKYEIDRTIAEIRKGKYHRVALQFPDELLPDAPKVIQLLDVRLKVESEPFETGKNLANDLAQLDIDARQSPSEARLYILADTSYGACCIDEIAAEHVDADVVVHYGRACLSPTVRIPVIYVFTVQILPQRNNLFDDFESFYQDKRQKIILAADVTYQSHLEELHSILKYSLHYEDIFMTQVLHDPSSPLPNRSIPDEVKVDHVRLKDWHLFHVSEPPDALLLTLASRVASIRIFPCSNSGQNDRIEPFVAATSRALSRRYALLTSVTTVSTFGILINTLSVKNNLHIVEHIKSRIQAAGKHSYTFVVGKVNAAKVANFSEVGAWVVIGCWESSLIDSKEFWKPVLTPYELDLALQSDGERLWTGEWSSDFQSLLDGRKHSHSVVHDQAIESHDAYLGIEGTHEVDGLDSVPESAPPAFDLRAGRYISESRPSNAQSHNFQSDRQVTDQTLIKRARGDLAVIGDQVSAGAEHLQSKRTWKGLGSDFDVAYEEAGTIVEQGRRGLAMGYAYGNDHMRT